ncbi:MAG: hypothetical protein AAF430_12370 [Myxococcota bacterium]
MTTPVAAQTEACEPWPGEPQPLPTVADPDSLRATWANLRTQELAQVARRFEESDPMRARQLWRRLLCMDPSNDAAVAGLMRTPPVRVHRPALSWAPLEFDRAGDAWALDAPLGVEIVRAGGASSPRPTASAPRPTTTTRAPSPRPAPPRAAPAPTPQRATPKPTPPKPTPQRPPAPRAAAPKPKPAPTPPSPPAASGSTAEDVAAIRSDVRGARFQAAIDRAVSVREQLSADGGANARKLLADTEVLVATAELALGRQGAAVTSLRRALAANPKLELDPITTPRKVVRALEQAREGATR